jgi:Zn ribbon nucleic-acid-binding protein
MIFATITGQVCSNCKDYKMVWNASDNRRCVVCGHEWFERVNYSGRDEEERRELNTFKE